MKNKILCLLMITVLTAGCSRRASMKELRELQLKVEERLEEYYNVNQNYNNFAGCGIDEEEMVLIVTLVNNNKEEKEWFKKNISDSKYIKFEKGGPYTTFDSNQDVILTVNNDTISNKGASFFLTNSSDKDYWYGPEYHLEKKDNNSWIKITTEYPLAWNTVLNTLKAHETITLEIDWSTTYGELTSGEYRLVKDNIREIDGESEKTSAYAVFTYFNIITGGTSNTIEVKKTTNHNTNKFNKYLEVEGRIVYFSSNIEEVYYNDLTNHFTLKDLTGGYLMTLDSSVNRFTNYLDEREIYKDGGSTMYKSKEFDITLIKCDTIKGNRDVFIGDYSLVFDGSLMCKR